MTAAPRARRLATALVVLTALALGPPTPGSAAPKPPTGTIDEYPTMASFSAPPSIAAGPDGSVWFTERSTNKVGRVTPAGVVTEFDVPTPASSPEGIVAGPDGNLWFTEHTGQKIGRMSPQGVTVAEYPIPASGSPVGTCFDLGGSPPCPRGITMGPDGNIWFTEFNGNKISRLRTSDGKIDQFPIPTPNSRPVGIMGGPGRAIWFTEAIGNKISRLSLDGQFTEWSLPSLEGGFNGSRRPVGITKGPDGKVWFAAPDSNQIGRLDPDLPAADAITLFDVPTRGAAPHFIVTGRDGNLWFTEFGAHRIGRMTSAGGVIGEYPTPTPDSGPHGIARGPDGNVWFTEGGAGQVGCVWVSD